MGKKIFIGFNNAAGYGTRLAKGFKSIGVNADLYLLGKHPFGYNIPEAKYVKYPSNIWLKRLYARYFFLKSLLKYDAFLFIAGDSLLKNYRDFKFYRIFKKKTMMIFVGCDVQQPQLTYKPHIPFSSCHNCTKDYKDFVGCIPETKIFRTRKIESLVDIIVSHPAFSDALNKEYINTIYPINIDEFPQSLTEISNEVPVILHAPSDFGYKGTKYLLGAIEKLKEEFHFEFRLKTNIPLEELYNEISKADIVVDQLIQGWFGLLPLEAMMFGKPVIGYLRDDVIAHLPKGFPVINANPDTIYDVLRKCLQNLDELKEIGKLGRQYVKKFHDAKNIAQTYADLLLNN